MTLLVIIVHVLVCLVLIGVVLLQHGKGADIGAVFGGGASQTVFGSRGAGNFLTRVTTVAAITFMLTSLTLSYWGAPRSVLRETPAEEGFAAPEVEVPESAAPEGKAPAGEVPSEFEEIPPPAKEPEPKGEAPSSPPEP